MGGLQISVVLVHYGMGKSGTPIIDYITRTHGTENVAIVKLEPEEEHGFYGWLIRSYIPALKVRVKPIDLSKYALMYLLAPKWGYSCPPLNGFIDSHNLNDIKLGLIVTYSKGNISGYVNRLIKKITFRGARVLTYLALKREDVATGKYLHKMKEFCDEIASGPSATTFHHSS